MINVAFNVQQKVLLIACWLLRLNMTNVGIYGFWIAFDFVEDQKLSFLHVTEGFLKIYSDCSLICLRAVSYTNKLVNLMDQHELLDINIPECGSLVHYIYLHSSEISRNFLLAVVGKMIHLRVVTSRATEQLRS